MFTVQEGAIRVSHANYPKFEGEFGHLFWKMPLAAFRIRFEYRLFGESLPGIQVWQASNSGLMFHSQAPATMREDQQFPVSLELQLLGIPRPVEEPSGNLCTPGTTVVFEGKRDPRHCILSASPLLPVGRWTRVELEVLPDGEITHLIDGEAVLRYSASELDPEDEDAQPLIATAGGELQLRQGYIALQSEGHQIEFRNIELRGSIENLSRVGKTPARSGLSHTVGRIAAKTPHPWPVILNSFQYPSFAAGSEQAILEP